ncbi:MAG TPA: methyltransferase domain-containing protein [Bacteroidales bacterium]|nr:methyltransferase domain-containing protein [Bacteroidales bacterium]HPS15951.1 methyltransferase domain-containing protein [Bacteroidales bacterium]
MLFDYKGKELGLFGKAINWKSYWSCKVKKYLGNKVLEVGAGMGNNVQFLVNEDILEYTCIEPDFELSEIIKKKIYNNELPSFCKSLNGTIQDLKEDQFFASILYFDVLEHIENDHEEIQKAALHLKPDGFLIILVPAHQYLYSPFDKQIGHYRRYNKQRLKKIIPDKWEVVEIKYMDSMGFLLSMVNHTFLKQKYPTQKQIIFWDKIVVPMSKIIDKVVFYKFGKSLLIIMKKPTI